MMTNTMTAAVAQSILCQLVADSLTIAATRSYPRVAAAIATLGEVESAALVAKEEKAWAKRRARWAKAVKAA